MTLDTSTFGQDAQQVNSSPTAFLETNSLLGASDNIALPASLGKVETFPFAVGDNTDAEKIVFRGTGNSDFLLANAKNNTLYGLAGDDVLDGKAGDDLINGGTGRDSLIGGTGKDTLLNYDGGDVYMGGEGADRFWFGGWDVPNAPSVITDFEVGTDKIKIGRLGVSFEQLTIVGGKGSAIVREGESVLAVLAGVDAEQVTADSFIFGDAEQANRLQKALDTSLKQTGDPGATNAIVTPDGFTWKGAAGFSNLAEQTPMRADDIFNIASTTKAFTAATVLKVVEEGTLSLDDTLGKWLPDIAKNISDSEGITIRQLLNGSGGIPLFDESEQFQQDFETGEYPKRTPEEIVSYVYELPRFSGLLSSSTWAYTNTSDIIAGLIVEKATNTPFHLVMREKVIEPLGLENTFFGGREEIAGNLARSYESRLNADGTPQTGGILEDNTEFDVANISAYWAAGALFSDADDVARFTQALFGGELLDSNSVKELTTFVDTGVPAIPRYGLGVLDISSAESPVGKQWILAGDSFGTQSTTLYLPDRNGFTDAVLVNKLAGDEIRESEQILISALNTFPELNPPQASNS